MAVDLSSIEIGYQTYLEEGGETFGAVREVQPDGGPVIVVYVENGGDFLVAPDAIRSVHDAKVILDPDRLDETMRDAIAHAHDAERPGL